MLATSKLPLPTDNQTTRYVSMIPDSHDGDGILPALQLMLQVRKHLLDPLNSVLVTSRLLDMQMYGDTTPQRTQAIRRIESSAQRIIWLLDEVSICLRAQANALELSAKDFSPLQLLEQIR